MARLRDQIGDARMTLSCRAVRRFRAPRSVGPKTPFSRAVRDFERVLLQRSSSIRRLCEIVVATDLIAHGRSSDRALGSNDVGYPVGRQSCAIQAAAPGR